MPPEIQRTSIQRMYGEEFFMRASELRMPWKKGPVYILVELVLKYSETSYRLAGGGTFWCAIEDTFDRALVKVAAEIKAQLED